MLKLVDYSKMYLECSWYWLNDPEIKKLTVTPDFAKEDQLSFYKALDKMPDYFIYGIEIDGVEAGACGLKKVNDGCAEYWGYIGEKKFWGRGYGKIILEIIQEKAILKGIYILNLKVIDENIRAKKLYLSNGFSIKEENDGILIMEKNLSNFSFSGDSVKPSTMFKME